MGSGLGLGLGIRAGFRVRVRVRVRVGLRVRPSQQMPSMSRLRTSHSMPGTQYGVGITK